MPVYKDLKRNSWYFRVYIIDEFGNQKQKTRSGFRTKIEAKEAEHEFLNNVNVDYNDLTFSELYIEFMMNKKQKLKYQSYLSLENRYKNHILPYFKDYKINKIDQKVYMNWKETILNKKLSYKYNSNLHGCMVSILNYAMDFYELEKNIASKLGNFPKNEYIKKVNFWTYEEFNQFIKIIDDNVYKCLYNTLYYTGMRLGECLALNWNDITENKINVCKTISKTKNNGNYIFNTPKTRNSNRLIQLDDITIQLLNELNDYYKTFINFNKEWFVFGGLNPLAPTTIGRRKDEYCKKSNVKRIKIHDLRHSHATLLLSKGVPITVISKRLGHADLTMTLNTYSHLVPEDENKAVSLINNIRME